MASVVKLDFSQFTHGSAKDRKKFGDELVKALNKSGFVKLSNHGLSDQEVEDVMQISRDFFHLPQSKKQELACPPGPNPQRGWTGPGSGEYVAKTRKENYEGLDVNKLIDAREHFDVGPEDDAQFPNRWPSDQDVPGFREKATRHYQTCRRIALQILEGIEVGLDLPGIFVDRCRTDASELCINVYPEIQAEKIDDYTKRIWPHTDYGVITLLFQDGVGGLELENQDAPGTFLPVTPTPPGESIEMVVNAADCFERWTNGFIKAGLHRVTTPCHVTEGKAVLPERCSLAYFLKATRDTMVGPLPQFVSEANPARFEEMTALEFQQLRNAVLY
ncbi:hypothetical protein MCOR02_006984 [Pyricularia oryzae]|uniref:Fe2OG dioxygenase domain-containing protein n=1 Tax=Pyricularia oryzae TaxID=318829 RepID=A0A4P7NRD5_PYROR|nr:hypothetical protein MCOR02_006984 [Pyricularia oryzae]KAI6470700.1 hypothetical protein MCOR17_003412 [Pyricularia oryzae]KAI6477476.1 hypothetical protein MCOR13_011768 [Pyricularia oryzae]KAI6585947.1 hypothetical protein MCOR04_004563 [Pyricularia oryzae]KAI6611782.1 hypothetical protein MCOR14_011801 [Pyricularia oryzae]